MTANTFAAELAKLQEKYVQTFPEKIQTLELLYASQDRAGLAELFHKLKGNGKTFGFAAITEIARLVDLHHKKNSPDYFQWAGLGITLFKLIYPSMQKKEEPSLEVLPEFGKLRDSLPPS
jgi:HPt (histidine-containing phosphotransfer) domain-containing protein